MWMRIKILTGLVAFCFLCGAGPPLPGTKPLTVTGDIASELVAGVDRFLLREIAESTAKRARYWKRDFSSIAAYNASVEPNRKRLAHILGVRDQRVRIGVDPQLPMSGFPEVGPGSVKVRVQWPAFGDVTGESVFSNPYSKRSGITIIVIPDADDTPEQLDGWLPGVRQESQVARRLIPSGYEVYRAGFDRPHRDRAQRPGQAHQP